MSVAQVWEGEIWQKSVADLGKSVAGALQRASYM